MRRGTAPRGSGTTAALDWYGWGFRAREPGKMLGLQIATGDDVEMIDAFTAGGIVSGAVGQEWVLRDALDAERPVDIDRATWYPLAGGAAERRLRVHLECEEVLLVCPESQEMPIHATWHAVDLDAGPYRITGELPTLPGFDPGRALARPGGPFVLLRDVRVEMIGRPDSGHVERTSAFVNRYAVERVAADIDLGFYFPGAHHETPAGIPTLA